MHEKIIETKSCKNCGQKFYITEKDKQFYEKVSPVFGNKKYNIPIPTFCPDCRQQRRLAWRNERKLYRKKCDLSGKPILSMISPEKPYKVYEFSEWFSDKRDPLEYGQDFDLGKKFFDQFEVLLGNVPMVNSVGMGNENCEYGNFHAYNKNCYLCFDYGWNEDCMYIAKSYRNKKCVDMIYCFECEDSFDLIDCYSCISSKFLQNCEQCYDCHLCWSCHSCSHCFLCTNQVNQKYCILNKQYTKEEYFQQLDKYKSLSNNELLEKYNTIIKTSIHKCTNNLSCENVQGDYLKKSKNCFSCFGGQELEDCAYIMDGIDTQDGYDDCFSGNKSFLYLETIGCEKHHNSGFCFSCWDGSEHIRYCHFCHNCKHCLGCIGLRNKQYCILNKQYTKEEYEILVQKIIGHMMTTGERGEFFPIKISPFGYNETLAQEYFPLIKQKVVEKGYKRMNKEYPINVPNNMETIKAKDLPDIIEKVDDTILNKAIVCEVSGKPFRIIKQELDFYRKHNLPLPKRHPDIRHQERLEKRPGKKLYSRNCNKCSVEIQTTYNPGDGEIVYCEKCYEKEMFS